MAPSMTQILIILLVVVVLFGAKKLPEIGGGLGKAIKNFRKASIEPDEIDITPKASPKKDPVEEEKK
ncbi:MAG: twin-arginine translocase TatA/TatE family subunit [Deltaproteobacteria bacterium]|jgi:sec-independent protein translocase protein TatA|nr:twin-arginine translocase TatA/TatE family subunit [Deltaproteobacteria bacterium]